MMFIRRPLSLAIILYLLITILFNYSLFCNAFFSCSQSHPSDGIITEYITETSWQHFKMGQNPYAFQQKLFYPFYSTYALADPGNANFVFFGLLRTVVSSHQALLLIVCLNLFLNYIVMYVLLRKLDMHFPIAWLGGFVFGAMPFISYRVLNHYTYTPLFLFPLLYLCVYMLFVSSKRNAKVFYAIMVSLVGVFLLLTNFYYFVSVLIAAAFLYCYSLLFFRKTIREIMNKNILYVALSALIFLYLLRPWLYTVFAYNTLYSTSKMIGFGGAWVLSSDLINVFLPSEHNPLYAFIFMKISSLGSVFQKLHTMFLSSYSRNAYAGILLLISIPVIICCKKNIASNIRKISIMFVCIGLFFLFLSFGPFLQIFNRWFISFEDVQVVLPMPFLLLHYIPGMDTLRAPSRFVPLYIFFMVLAASYFWNEYYERISSRYAKYIILTAVCVLAFLDQLYIMPQPAAEYQTTIPFKLYEKIAQDETKGAVLEIPFTIRDGFSYRGNVKAVTPMKGVLMHDRPIIGGYIARVAPEIFSYYDSLPFISGAASLIDEGNSENKIETKKISSFNISNQTVSEELEMLNITHIITPLDQSYSAQIIGIVQKIGYRKVAREGRYALYKRPFSKRQFARVDFTLASVSPFFTAIKDASSKKSAYQFTTHAKLFLNTKSPKEELVIKAKSEKTLAYDIYVNGTYKRSLSIENIKKRYTIPITIQQDGIQMIDIVATDKQSDIQTTLYAVEIQ